MSPVINEVPEEKTFGVLTYKYLQTPNWEYGTETIVSSFVREDGKVFAEESLGQARVFVCFVNQVISFKKGSN
jgi:hypothetical protein